MNGLPNKKEEPPSTRRTAADGGVGHRTGMAPCPRGSIPQVKLKIEKNPPLTRPLASRGQVVALSPTREVPMHYHFTDYHNGGGGWEKKKKFECFGLPQRMWSN